MGIKDDAQGSPTGFLAAKLTCDTLNNNCLEINFLNLYYFLVTLNFEEIFGQYYLKNILDPLQSHMQIVTLYLT